jgi:hypothetical protein
VHPANAHLRAYLTAVASLPGGERHERDGVLWCRSTIPWPMFNGAVASADGEGAAEAIASLVEGGRPWFAWQLPDSPPALVEAAVQAGAREFDRSPWMEARIADLTEPELPDGATVESPLTDRESASKQGDEGAPDARVGATVAPVTGEVVSRQFSG